MSIKQVKPEIHSQRQNLQSEQLKGRFQQQDRYKFLWIHYDDLERSDRTFKEVRQRLWNLSSCSLKQFFWSSNEYKKYLSHMVGFSKLTGSTKTFKTLKSFSALYFHDRCFFSLMPMIFKIKYCQELRMGIKNTQDSCTFDQFLGLFSSRISNLTIKLEPTKNSNKLFNTLSKKPIRNLKISFEYISELHSRKLRDTLRSLFQLRQIYLFPINMSLVTGLLHHKKLELVQLTIQDQELLLKIKDTICQLSSLKYIKFSLNFFPSEELDLSQLNCLKMEQLNIIVKGAKPLHASESGDNLIRSIIPIKVNQIGLTIDSFLSSRQLMEFGYKIRFLNNLTDFKIRLESDEETRFLSEDLFITLGESLKYIQNLKQLKVSYPQCVVERNSSLYDQLDEMKNLTFLSLIVSVTFETGIRSISNFIAKQDQLKVLEIMINPIYSVYQPPEINHYHVTPFILETILNSICKLPILQSLVMKLGLFRHFKVFRENTLISAALRKMTSLQSITLILEGLYITKFEADALPKALINLPNLKKFKFKGDLALITRDIYNNMIKNLKKLNLNLQIE